MSVKGTLVEAKMCTSTLESTHFNFKKCAIYTHDGARAKFSTNSHEADYSVEGFTYVKAFIQICLTSTLFCLINKTGTYHIKAFEYPFNFF